MPTYDPKKGTTSFAGGTLVEFGTDSIVKASYNEDAFTLKVGATGGAVRTRSANLSGRIEVTLLISSPSNDFLQQQFELDRAGGGGRGPFLYRDLSGTALCQAENAWITKLPDLERGKEAGEVTWVFETDRLNAVQGSVVTE